MSIDIFQSKELKKDKKIKTDPITSETVSYTHLTLPTTPYV